MAIFDLGRCRDARHIRVKRPEDSESGPNNSCDSDNDNDNSCFLAAFLICFSYVPIVSYCQLLMPLQCLSQFPILPFCQRLACETCIIRLRKNSCASRQLVLSKKWSFPQCRAKVDFRWCDDRQENLVTSAP